MNEEATGSTSTIDPTNTERNTQRKTEQRNTQTTATQMYLAVILISNDDLSDFTTDQSEVNSDNEDHFQNNINEHDLDDLLNRFNAVNLNIEINNAMARQELTRNHIDIIPKYEGDPNTLSMYIGACEYLAVTFGNPQNPADAMNGFLL
ncbi:hypothetical protein QE152_g4429 [Popillia japonica]|uniref:Uncharacterized protein n=1 Tax=Popillia japonica TaxID=7064 RepID=A0AAW1N1E6_POPJA